jgi:hypothetical protein
MGKYINPPSMSKEQFLEAYGTEITLGDFLRENYTDQHIQQNTYVILVDNGSFTAARIVMDDMDYDLMKRQLNGDGRPKKFYTVPTIKVEPYL